MEIPVALTVGGTRLKSSASMATSRSSTVSSRSTTVSRTASLTQSVWRTSQQANMSPARTATLHSAMRLKRRNQRRGRWSLSGSGLTGEVLISGTNGRNGGRPLQGSKRRVTVTAPRQLLSPVEFTAQAVVERPAGGLDQGLTRLSDRHHGDDVADTPCSCPPGRRGSGRPLRCGVSSVTRMLALGTE